MSKHLRAKIRTIFFAGLLVTLPLTLTVWLFAFLFNKLDSLLSPYVNQGLAFLSIKPYFLTDKLTLPGVGVIATILIVFLVGILTTSYVGRKIVGLGESMVGRIPYFRGIYSAAKQVLEAITISERGTFRQVVMVEYPRRDLWALGFLTCEADGEVQAKTDDFVIYVFLPTTPNPTSGYLVAVPKKDIILLDMSIEEGIKLIISGGIIAPNDKIKSAPRLADVSEETSSAALRKGA